ncbi:MAG: SNF2-related protein, partial [Singulisphaera sp.]
RKRLKWVVKQALSPAELKSAFLGLKRTLYPYQREGVERFLAAGRLLLADDMGLGKTAQAIASCEILWRTRRIRRGLIIAPASLKPQWAREWAGFSDLPIRVVDGTPAERQAIYDSRRSGFLIINYEQLLRDLEVVRHWGPDLVVLDEAQRIKNWATKTALSVKGLTPPHRLVLTGTPMENRIEELASIVEWVDDMALEPKWRLNPFHSVYDDGRREVRGVRHLDTLRERLKPCMVRRIRQDVLTQLPSRTDVRVPVEMTEAQLEEHNALNQPIAQLVQRSKTRPLTQAQFLRLMSLLTTQRIISNGLVQLRFEEVWPAIRPCAPEESVIQGLSAPKLLELRQLIRQLMLGQGRQVVIFSQWRRMLTLAHWAVSDLLAENGLRAGFFTGAEGQRRRTQNIVEFHDDPNHRLLFASDAGGVGLNLQHAANCVINLELPWNPAVLEQRIGRIYRLGQKQPIDVYNLVCEVGIESRIAGLVGTKQAFFKGLFDGDSDSVQFEHSGSFLSKVEKIIEESMPTSDLDPEGQEGDPSEFADLISDDEVGDPYDELVDAADESQDQAEAQPGSVLVDADQASFPQPPDHEERQDVPRRPTTSTSAEVRGLFSQLRIRREVDGRVIIEAPAEAASTLGALFEGMAALLQSMTTSPEADDPA